MVCHEMRVTSNSITIVINVRDVALFIFSHNLTLNSVNNTEYAVLTYIFWLACSRWVHLCYLVLLLSLNSKSYSYYRLLAS